MGIQRVFNIKSTFDLFALHRHGMHDFIKFAMKSFIQKADGNQKLNIRQSIFYMHRLDEMIILSTISFMLPLTLCRAINNKQNYV